MAHLVEIEFVKTYATKENVVKAVEKKFENAPVRYIIVPLDNGRFSPLFVGTKALEYGVHFHFNIVA
jgi:hypothetical protein